MIRNWEGKDKKEKEIEIEYLIFQKFCDFDNFLGSQSHEGIQKKHALAHQHGLWLKITGILHLVPIQDPFHGVTSCWEGIADFFGELCSKKMRMTKLFWSTEIGTLIGPLALPYSWLRKLQVESCRQFHSGSLPWLEERREHCLKKISSPSQREWEHLFDWNHFHVKCELKPQLCYPTWKWMKNSKLSEKRKKKKKRKKKEKKKKKKRKIKIKIKIKRKEEYHMRCF